MLEFILRPWRLILLFLASQLNREQQRAIEYLHVESQVLREKLGKRRRLLNDDQCRRLPRGHSPRQSRPMSDIEWREFEFLDRIGYPRQTSQ